MSRKNFGPQPTLYPMPVLIIGTYDENGTPNAMNAAWGGISDNTEITIALSSHKSTDNLLKNGAFTVSMATVDTVIPCDYVGIESANKVPNKVEKAGFTCSKSEFVNAPIFDQLPMTLECKVKSYQNEVLVGTIVNVCADESILTEGKIDVSKLNPITYDPISHKYIALGKVVGNAFSDGKQIK